MGLMTLAIAALYLLSRSSIESLMKVARWKKETPRRSPTYPPISAARDRNGYRKCSILCITLQRNHFDALAGHLVCHVYLGAK